ncbi:hypothetical protein CVU37_07170 [candidate division BRC1 bacterium HGW-BRC1-1]|jgi:hypothetical protein|nr:MAG: hypothetical protein CVU37_07170 [candidate division BRC1 bacterium HGW-BRC1-1]
MSQKWLRTRTLKWIIVLLLANFVLLFVVVPYCMRSYVRSRLSPNELAVIERAYKPPQFPASWAQVEPLLPEMQTALVAFDEAWKNRVNYGKPWGPTEGQRDLKSISNTYAQIATGPPLSDADRVAAETFVKQDAELVTATLALAARPDFETGALDAPAGAVGEGRFIPYNTGAKLAQMSARLDALNGETSRGLATATSVLALARRHPASSFFAQVFAISENLNATRTIADIAAQCDDPAALRATLAEMERLDPQVNLPLWDAIELIDVLGNLRALKREGYPVDLDFSKPATYLIDQNNDSMERFAEWKIEQLAPDDPLHAEYAKHLETRYVAPRRSRLPKGFRFLGRFYNDAGRDIMMTVAVPDSQVAYTRQEVTAARFHLTELALAERIAKLEGAAAPTAPGDLVPKYLVTEPMDPFTSASFPRSATGGFYSLGPDKHDDQGALTYDPTNGTLSAGDIVMRAP